MATIKLNYNGAIRESNRLKTVATQCQDSNALIDRLIRNVETYWQGESARAFIDELNQWKRENNSISTEANNLSQTVRRVANDIRAAERRAAAAMKG